MMESAENRFRRLTAQVREIIALGIFDDVSLFVKSTEGIFRLYSEILELRRKAMGAISRKAYEEEYISAMNRLENHLQRIQVEPTRPEDRTRTSNMKSDSNQ